jgi:hypothetical protein
MRKIFLVLFVAIAFSFFSCEKKEIKTNYLDNKIIEGKWYALAHGDSMLYTFKNNRVVHEYYAYVPDLDALKPELNMDLGTYLINETSIFISIFSEGSYEYRFGNENNDSLYIKESEIWRGYKRLE